MEEKKSQINREMIPNNRPFPDAVRELLNEELEPKLIKLFNMKNGWSQNLNNYWEMFKLAALQESVGEIEFYNESNEKDDLL